MLLWVRWKIGGWIELMFPAAAVGGGELRSKI
jgi:hypothetical protein